jgi:predicted dehydrogenase
MSTPLKIAFIGCGAIAEACHLPALAAAGLRPALLIDPNQERTRKLSDRFGGQPATDYQACADQFNAAVVALPHHLHEPVAGWLLRRGVHVLLEKPMATSERECRAIVEAAEASNAVLAVGQNRRHLRAARWVKDALDAGVLGRLRSFDLAEGHELEWAPASDFQYRKETAGGGVLISSGVHSLDLLLWWLGEHEAVEYADDSYGGIEADCELKLRLKSGAEGRVELSTNRKLRNTIILRGDRGELEVSVFGESVTARPAALLRHRWKEWAGHRLPEQEVIESFRIQMQDWLEAIAAGRPPLVTGREAMRSIPLIEACYARRQPLEFPWVRPEKFFPVPTSHESVQP